MSYLTIDCTIIQDRCLRGGARDKQTHEGECGSNTKRFHFTDDNPLPIVKDFLVLAYLQAYIHRRAINGLMD